MLTHNKQKSKNWCKKVFLIPQSTTITIYSLMQFFKHGIDDFIYFCYGIIFLSILHSGRELSYVLCIMFFSTASLLRFLSVRQNIFSTGLIFGLRGGMLNSFIFLYCHSFAAALQIWEKSPSWTNKLPAGLQLFLIIFLNFSW